MRSVKCVEIYVWMAWRRHISIAKRNRSMTKYTVFFSYDDISTGGSILRSVHKAMSNQKNSFKVGIISNNRNKLEFQKQPIFHSNKHQLQSNENKIIIKTRNNFPETSFNCNNNFHVIHCAHMVKLRLPCAKAINTNAKPL